MNLLYNIGMWLTVIPVALIMIAFAAFVIGSWIKTGINMYKEDRYIGASIWVLFTCIPVGVIVMMISGMLGG